MVHPRPLTERDHPLRESGKEGVELYVGESAPLQIGAYC